MKLFKIFILNIPICIALNWVCILIILNQRIYPDTFKNPSIILLEIVAVIVNMYIVYEIMKHYNIVSKKSLIICLSGVVVTWCAYLLLTIF